MKILRVLNTNAIVTIDENSREIIVTGAGIGFKKKRGDLVDKSQIDKIYCLKNDEFNKRLQNIVENISEKYLSITGKVVDAAKKSGIKTNDILYVTLTDHINSAIERYKSDIHLKNILKLDIQKFYSQEYIIGKQAVIWIAKETGIDLGDDEAAFIAMHIVSSELDNSLTSDVQKMTELINSILKIIRISFKIDFNEESISYQRFITHLKFFAARIMTDTEYKDSMNEIYEVMINQNPKAVSGVEKIKQLIKKEYNHELSVDESLYLLIHIKRLLDEQNID